MNFDLEKLADEAKWLLENPDFEQRPATIREFLGEGYLEIEDRMRPGLVSALEELFGEEVNTERIARYERFLSTGAIGVGKQLDPTEVVLTPSGEWVEIQSLQVGDLVVGSDGKGYRVNNKTEWGNVERYRITFKDNTWINCGADHLWTLLKRSVRNRQRVVTRETLDTRTLSLRELKHRDTYVYDLPLVAPIQYENKYERFIDPYLMGLMIGNGSFSKITPSVAHDDKDSDWLRSKLEKIVLEGIFIVKSERNRFHLSTGSQRRVFNGNSVQAEIRRVGLESVTALHKYIPKEYLYAQNPEDRLSLLRGLLDSDGCAMKDNGSNYSTSSRLLSKDVSILIRSLGGYCTITSFKRDGVLNTEYQVHVNLGSVCPFENPRKVARWKPRTNQPIHRSVKSVEQIENGPGVCISVDAPDNLYVTKDFIVTHNTTFVSIALVYMVHWTLCLRDPQKFYKLLPGTRIAFMQMSTSATQALEVVFGDIKARIDTSPWFQENYPYDNKRTKQLRFPKDIWVVPGSSLETSFEGFNVLTGILDEMDSHRQTDTKDFADVGYDAIESRIASRFIDEKTGGHRGLMMCVGQMKKSHGFAARKYAEFLEDDRASVVRMTIWESLGWQRFLKEDGTRDSFWYDIKRKLIIPEVVAELIEDQTRLIEVPTAYKTQFKNNPEKALRDLAGIPPATDDAFISLVDRIEDCRDRWHERHGDALPVDSSPTRPRFAEWLRADSDPRKRAVHIDLSYSDKGDALGLAMGYVDSLVEIDGEDKPYIVFDFLARIRAAPGTEIIFSDVRNMIYELKDERKFKILDITLDSFNSQDTIQQFRRRKFRVDILSVDRNTLPYEDLREAIYDRRLEFPKYMTYLNKGDSKMVEIALQELMTLQHNGKKIDHTPLGSKDVADAMAGVVTTLMGDRTYRRGSKKRSVGSLTDSTNVPVPGDGTSSIGQFKLPSSISGIPSLSSSGNLIPPHLQRRP